MKNKKLLYWVSTGLLTAMMLMSVGMYFFKHQDISMAFTSFGYPTYLIYPLGIAKLLGLAAIWYNKSSVLKEWAYAGFFFNFILAFFAHFMIGDGEQMGALMAFILLIISYYSWKNQTV